MNKYPNGRVMVRGPGGRFARNPSLADLGYDISDGREQACIHCGHKQRPLLNTGWICGRCDGRQPERLAKPE